MRIVFLFLCAAVIVCSERTNNPPDYATLTLQGSQAALYTTLGVGNAEALSARLDFDSHELALCRGSGASSLPVVFNEDTMTNPVRASDYVFKMGKNCTAGADAVVGLRSRTSPLWRVWTYASYARQEVRLGRAHPKNTRPERTLARVRCSGLADERLCLVRNVRLDQSLVDLDFHSNDNHVYLPHAQYVHYTSAAQQCVKRSIRNVEEWPSLKLYNDDSGTLLFSIAARHFVPHDYEATFETHSDERCEFIAMLLRTSGVLVPHEEKTVLLSSDVALHEYTLQRDYLRSTMSVHAVHVQDHFTYWELLAVVFVFVLYVAYKSTNASSLASYTLGVLPVCTLCQRPMYSVCVNEPSWELKTLHDTWQRRARMLRVANYVAKLALFAIAWYAVGVSSRLGVGYNEQEIVVWTFVVLGVASLQFVAAEVHHVYVLASKKRTAAVRAFNEQNWQFLHAESVESACIIALFVLTSIVRSDDLGSQLNVVVSVVVVYDGMRRFTALLAMYVVRMAYMRRVGGAESTLFIAWLVRAFVVTLGLQVVYTLYIVSTHVFTVALTSKTWSAIFVLFALFLALSVNVAHLRRSMEEHLLCVTKI